MDVRDASMGMNCLYLRWHFTRNFPPDTLALFAESVQHVSLAFTVNGQRG
jgi:hypothetical protein